MTSKKKYSFSFVLILFATIRVFASITSINEKIELLSIDLPEGFSVVEATKDQKSFQLEYNIVPVNAIISLHDNNKTSTAKATLEDVLKKFNAITEIDTFIWRTQECALATFSASIGEFITGYALSVTLPLEQGIIVLITWNKAQYGNTYSNFMLSFLDSLNIDEGSYRSQGAITEYIYPTCKEEQKVNINIEGIEIQTALKQNDKEASQALIEREYQVLCYYQKSDLWQKAWQRFYKMIYRDSFKRLQRVSFDITNALLPYCNDETELAQMLLTWTQGFSYQRETTASDFASLPSIILGGGSDCDSRSMLLAVLLNSMNLDSVIFVSNVYSHALAGFVSSHPGHSFKVKQKEYLMGETTAKGLTWGKIPEKMDNQNNWITVEFE